RIDSDLPRGVRVHVVRQDPARPGLLYAGTRSGVAVSFDDGGHWQSLRLDMPRTAINDLAVKGSDLIAATQGRALWVLDDVTPLRHVGTMQGVALAPPATAIR